MATRGINVIKYRLYGGKIERINVDRETDSYVYYTANYASSRSHIVREKKITQYSRWFDSWKDAHDYIVTELEIEVEKCRRILEIAKGRLGQAKGMKQTKEGEI